LLGDLARPLDLRCRLLAQLLDLRRRSLLNLLRGALGELAAFLDGALRQSGAFFLDLLGNFPSSFLHVHDCPPDIHGRTLARAVPAHAVAVSVGARPARTSSHRAQSPPSSTTSSRHCQQRPHFFPRAGDMVMPTRPKPSMSRKSPVSPLPVGARSTCETMKN